MSKQIKETVEKSSEVISRVDLRRKGIKLKKSGKKRYALLTLNDGTGRTLEGIKKIKPNTTHIMVKDKEFLFDITKSIYSSKLKVYYLIDINLGQLHLDTIDTQKFNPRNLKKLIREQAIAQTLTRQTTQQAKLNFMVAVFFMIFGGLVGYLVALYSSGVLG